ncbi:MAG TPA: C40 family peptidase [Vicinamibacterales bacterium]|nr:C40 family peptidase [Vicinamibacterales bacterium]
MRRTIRLLILVALPVAAAACASGGGVPRPEPFPGAAAPPEAAEPRSPARTAARAVIATALMYQGVPYLNGGSDPKGFDCSGFVQWVFARNGLALPREVHDQYRVGRKIDRDDIHPGDLVFFHTERRGASHVGIALDGDRFVHAPSSRGVVRIERYTTAYWKKRYVGARRIAEERSARK